MRKSISILLVLLLIMSIVSGCSSNKESTDTTAQSSGRTTGTSETTKVDSSKPTETLTYTLMGHGDTRHGEWSKMWLFEEIEKIFNIRFNITEVSAETWNEKKSIAFATNSLPDAFASGQGGLDNIELATYGSKGMLLKLNDYLEKYAPDVTAMFKEYPETRVASTFPDGNIFAFYGFTKHPRDMSIYKFWLNKQWAENLNVPIPTTLDEFYTYLKAVKDGDPNGNGDSKDEIPLVAMYGPQNNKVNEYDISIPILTAMGFTSNRLDIKDNEVIFVPVQPLYKEYLAYMNKLFTEGLLDSEYFTQTHDQRKAKLNQGIAGAFGRSASWVDVPNKEIWSQYGNIEPMTSKFNSQKIWSAYDTRLLSQFVITSKAENPENLVKLANWFYTNEGTLASAVGVENGKWSGGEGGYKWTKNSEGVECHELVYPKDKYSSFSDFRLRVITPRCFPWVSTPSIPLTEWVTSLDESQVYLTREILISEPYLTVRWSENIKFTEQESKEANLILTDLNNYISQMEAQMITGEIKLDQFDTFVQGLNKRGLERYLKICQDAYDRWKK